MFKLVIKETNFIIFSRDCWFNELWRF